MQHITLGELHGSRHRHTIAAAFWLAVGMVAVIVFGDAFALLALALAIVTMAWWICREVEHVVKSNDAQRHAARVDSRAGH
jgi:hypothetical protein